jgi:hypothetical protein
MLTDSTAKHKHLSDVDRRRLTEESGISEHVMKQRGYYTARTQAELAALGFANYQRRVPALVLPIHDVHGTVALHQLRPEIPRKSKRNKTIKYETPGGAKLRLDVHPLHRERLKHAEIPLIITEGLRKEDSILSACTPERPLCVLGLIGTEGWRREGKPLPDWRKVALKGRKIVIVFDSDAAETPEVAKARTALAQFLAKEGARVQMVDLPEAGDGSKCGADDYLAAGHTLEDMLKLAHDDPSTKRQRAIRISARTLLSTTYDPLTFVVEDILPAGCTLLTGKSKDGKSFMGYDIAVAVASDGKALGKYAVTPGAVWYMALEDGERRAQARLKRMQERTETELSEKAQERLEFTLWKAPRLGEGLEQDITDWITSTSDARLIVIDILEKVRPLRKVNGNSYADDYGPTSTLAQLAQEHNVAILIVHHSNKRDDVDDFRDTASGCMSLIGGADNYWSLSRLPMSEDASLKITGRDIEQECDLAMQFKDGYWTALGDARLVVMSGERKALVEVLRQSPRSLTPKQIAGELDKNYNTTKILLRKLLDTGVVIQPTDGHYTLSPSYIEETKGQGEAKGQEETSEREETREQEEDTPPFDRDEQPTVPPPSTPPDTINPINPVNPIHPIHPVNPAGENGHGFTPGLRRVYGKNGDRKPSEATEIEEVAGQNGARAYGVYTPAPSSFLPSSFSSPETAPPAPANGHAKEGAAAVASNGTHEAEYFDGPPCWTCKGTRYWMNAAGELVCVRCHPKPYDDSGKGVCRDARDSS